MRAIELMLDTGMSLRRALEYSKCSRNIYYYKPTPRTVELNPFIVEKVKEISLERPSFGTRRMAAMLERELHMPINRKRVQRIFHALKWIEPSRKKSEIIRSASKLVQPTRPFQLWETDLTYVWFGVDEWCYIFNVLMCSTGSGLDTNSMCLQ